MRKHITNREKRRTACAFVVFLCILSGCTDKSREPLVQEGKAELLQEETPVLAIPFVTVMDNYFLNNDTSAFSECIGKIVKGEELDQLDERYSGGPAGERDLWDYDFDIYSFEAKDEKLWYKKVILTYNRMRRLDGLVDWKILDIASLEGDKEYLLTTESLYEDDTEDLRNKLPVRNHYGAYDLILENGLLPLDKRIFPRWIITVNGEGKLIISKPEDDRMYVFFPDDPV